MAERGKPFWNHAKLTCIQTCKTTMYREGGELLLPGALQAAPKRATAWDLNEIPVPLTQQEQSPHSCHLQLLKRPDIGGTMPSERQSFTPSSILFRPHQIRSRMTGIRMQDKSNLLLPVIRHLMWWRRRVPPPGPNGLLRLPFIAIAGQVRQVLYMQ